MTALGLILAALGFGACAYLAGFIPGPSLPISEETGFSLIVGSLVVGVVGLLVAVIGWAT